MKCWRLKHAGCRNSIRGEMDADLMQLLKFDAQELESNRYGRMSLKQRMHVLHGLDAYFTFLVALLPIGVVAWTLGFVPAIQVLFLAAIAVIVGVFNLGGPKALSDIVTGQVKAVRGPLTIKVHTRTARTFAGAMQQQVAIGTIGRVTFELPVDIAHRFEGKTLQLYYTPRLRKVVSAEVME